MGEGASVLGAMPEVGTENGVGMGTDSMAGLVVSMGAAEDADSCEGGAAADVTTDIWHWVFMTTVQ